MVHTIIGSSLSVTIETSCRMDSARKNNGGKIPFDPIIEDISFDIAWMQVGVALTTTIRITSTNKNTFLEIWMISQHIRINCNILYFRYKIFIQLSYQSRNRQSLWTLEKFLPVMVGHFEDCSFQWYFTKWMILTNNKEKISNLHHFM